MKEKRAFLNMNKIVSRKEFAETIRPELKKNGKTHPNR